MDYLYFLLCSVMFSVALHILYFTKKHINTKETKVFSIALISNLIGLVLEIGCKISIYNLGVSSIISFLLVKAYLVYLIFFVFIMSIYVYYINCDYKAKVKTYISIFFSILGIIVLLLPLKIKVAYATGTAVDFVYLVSALTMVIWVITIVINRKKDLMKKNIPMVSFIILGTLAGVLQNINAQMTLITSFEFLILFIMYHTIENPDLKLLEQINQEKDRADKANQAKSDFLSSMSHEIRTPLNGIVGFAEALKQENLPEEAEDEVNDIIMASQSLVEIVNGILDISKIEANKLEIIDSEYSFSSVFDSIVALTKARIGDKSLDFRIYIDESIPEVLYGDHARVKQIVINLLTNAVKYTKEGFIEFKVSGVVKNNMCRLIISVEDSGIGIKPEKINKLFTKFERLDVEKNTTVEGTGLGLAITKSLVELMNGKIVVQSIPDKGSKFTVALDQRIIKMKDDKKPEAAKEEVKQELHFADKKILVVDDNKINLKVATRLLKNYGISTTEVDSGYECIMKINSGATFDLILLDDMMPKMSGTETLKKLKENEQFKIPTIALTANAITGMKEKYLNDGFDDYMAKPIELKELERVLKKYLSK